MDIDFRRRSLQKELIDNHGNDEAEVIRNLKELDNFNKITGNNSFVLKKIVGLFSEPEKEYHLVDLGCGGGQFLIDAHKFAKKRKLKLKLTGVDNNQTANNYLQTRIQNGYEIKTIDSDYKQFLKDNSTGIDIIYNSLFCHHLDNNEIINLIEEARRLKAILVINDLVRSPVAYYMAKSLTTIFRGTSLAKHDGPLSVLRAFTQNEIINLAIKANACCFFYYKMPFFRFLLIIKPGSNDG